MRILITGNRGFIGSRSEKVLGKEHDVVGIDKDEADISQFVQIAAIFRNSKPEFVLHCAAMGDVEYSEAHQDHALKANVIATRNIASLCADADIPMMFCSTERAYRYKELSGMLREYAPTQGSDFYGFTKAICEEEIKSKVKKHYIMRIAWQYGLFEEGMPQPGQRVGMTEIAKLALEKNEPITVVRGARQTPAYVYDTIDAFRFVITQRLPYGVYNVTSESDLTVKEMYCAILKAFGADEKKITELIREVDEEPYRLTMDPYYLKCYGYQMPGFEEGLKRCMREVYHR
jgi:dTDP-4-dehydrorhamnose reductase